MSSRAAHTDTDCSKRHKMTAARMYGAFLDVPGEALLRQARARVTNSVIHAQSPPKITLPGLTDASKQRAAWFFS